MSWIEFFTILAQTMIAGTAFLAFLVVLFAIIASFVHDIKKGQK